MIAGILYFDGSIDKLSSKLHTLVELYATKFEILPNCCHIHPKTAELIPDFTIINGFGENSLMLRLVRDETIPIHGFWLGVDDEGWG